MRATREQPKFLGHARWGFEKWKPTGHIKGKESEGKKITFFTKFVKMDGRTSLTIKK